MEVSGEKTVEELEKMGIGAKKLFKLDEKEKNLLLGAVSAGVSDIRGWHYGASLRRSYSIIIRSKVQKSL